jgi:Ca-activated chloride channel homolog
LNRASSIRLQATCIALAAVCFPGFARANPADARRLLNRGDFQGARERYQALADEANSSSRRAALRLGEGLAAYRGGDFRGARAGFSGALLGPDPQVRRQAHLGLGNSLFQLGWMGLAESAYPADPEQVPDLDAFDAIARERIARMLDSPEPEIGETDGFARIRDTILNWSDAARHYQSALDLDPRDSAALANRRTTMAFLERLQDLLQEERDETEQSMPEPSPGEGGGEGEAEPGEGEPGEEPGEDGEGGENEDPESQSGDRPDDSDSPGGEGESDEDPREGESDGEPQEGEPNPGEDEGEEADPNETPEDRARRILNENADVETGPLTPGRREFMLPEKDW